MSELINRRSIGYAGVAAVVALIADRFIALSSELSHAQSLLARYRENGEELVEILDRSEGETSLFSLLLQYAVPISMLGATIYLVYSFLRDVQNTRQEFSFRHISGTAVMLYKIDTFLSSSVFAKTYIFLIFVLMLITVGGLLFSMITGDAVSSSFWQVWLLIVDAGAHGDFDGTARRAIGLLLSCFGLIVFTLLIGITSELLAEKINQLNEGRSRVLEANHTLILGWSDKTLPIISEIAIANESMGGSVIVVLCDEAKQEIERRIEAAELNMRGSRVVVRSGSPLLSSDLRKVGAEYARAIVVLSKDGDVEPDEADAITLRAVLSLVNMPLRGHVVAELRDVDNKDILQIVGGTRVEVVVAHDIIGRIMLLASMQPGLALVLDKLLGFEGAEFYLSEWPDTVGLTFRDAFFLFPEAVLLGIARKEDLEEIFPEENPQNGTSMGSPNRGSTSLNFGKWDRNSQPKLWLNPPVDTIIRPGDKLICLADDDDSYAPMAPRLSQADRYLKRAQRAIQRRSLRGPVIDRAPTHCLFIGWRRDVDDMITELETYVAPGSTLTLLNEVEVEKRMKLLADGGLDTSKLHNLTIHHIVGSPLSRRTYETGDWGRASMSYGDDTPTSNGCNGNSNDNERGSGGCLLTRFDSVLILADETYECNMQNMDSRSLTTLLLVRDINAKHEQRLIREHVRNVEKERVRRGSCQASPVPDAVLTPGFANSGRTTLSGIGNFSGNESPFSQISEDIDEHADLLVSDWSEKITVGRKDRLHAQIRTMALAGRLTDSSALGNPFGKIPNDQFSRPAFLRGASVSPTRSAHAIAARPIVSRPSSASLLSSASTSAPGSILSSTSNSESLSVSMCEDDVPIKIIGNGVSLTTVPTIVSDSTSSNTTTDGLSTSSAVETEQKHTDNAPDSLIHTPTHTLTNTVTNTAVNTAPADNMDSPADSAALDLCRISGLSLAVPPNVIGSPSANMGTATADAAAVVEKANAPTGVSLTDDNNTTLARSSSDLILPPAVLAAAALASGINTGTGPAPTIGTGTGAEVLSSGGGPRHSPSPLSPFSPALCAPPELAISPPNVVELARTHSQLTVIAEVLDSRTKTLVSQATSSHYVASNELVSKAIAMVAEDKAVGTILQELLTAEGSETYVRPAGYLIQEGEVASMWDVSARALSLPSPEIVIGYIKNMSGHSQRLKAALTIMGRQDLAVNVSCDGDATSKVEAEESEEAEETEWMSHVVLNPQRKEDLILWSERDFFVVIAQE